MHDKATLVASLWVCDQVVIIDTRAGKQERNGATACDCTWILYQRVAEEHISNVDDVISWSKVGA